MILNVVSLVVKKTRKVITSRSKRLLGSKREYFLYVALAITIAASYYIVTREPPPSPMSRLEANALVENRLKQYYLEEKGKGCDIPKVDPFSAEAMSYYWDEPKVTCQGTDWVVCHISECYVKKEILKNMTEVNCLYSDIIYEDDRRYFLSDNTTVTGSETYMLNKSDYVKIFCTGWELNSFGLQYARWSGIKAGFRPVQTEPVPPGRKDSYNVMILAFDSASHSGFIRKMPKSYGFLANRSIILNGHNVVGDGTIAAMFALLTGMAEYEHADARTIVSPKVFVDHKLFIFHQLKEYGYQTLYFEDTPRWGTFQFKFNGFLRQPADHYARAFFLEKEKSFENFYCLGDTPTYQMFLNLTNEFLKFEGKKFSLTFISDICHSNFNLISTADDDVLWFLETLAARRVFEDTLVIVMGDHGNRIPPIRHTYQGKLEERLPLMAIFLPEKLKQLRPEALEALSQNVDVLTTPFDIHTTLLDVLDLKHKRNMYKIPGSDLTRSMTLLEPIPESRTCAEAGIVQHWCSCTKWFNVSEVSDMYKRVANVLAEYIDSVSEEQRSKCARRKLLFIHYVLQLNVNKHLLKYQFKKEEDNFLGNPSLAEPRALIEYYQAKIVMSPGRAVYEGTLTYYTQPDYFWLTYKDVSRTSRYGTEPDCISATHPHLSPFCYCKQHPPRENDLN